VSQGLPLDSGNPPASVFRLAAGAAGYRLFGVVMWAAAITSVVGSAYTSVSFLRSVAAPAERHQRGALVAFIVISTAVFLTFGRPVKVLILAGALNGLILPICLAVVLIAAHRPAVVGEYRHPLGQTMAGIVVVAGMAMLSGWTLWIEVPKLLR
jgi:Mn2+/Fe2+ NRAMP family transporter